MSTTTTKPATKVENYLFFDGRCEEALDFYTKAIGAKITVRMRFSDSPEACPEGKIPPGTENKIMHASFTIGETNVMASDGHCSGAAKFEGFGLSITAVDEADADRLFAALVDGGQVVMPLGKTFYSPRFGMLTDRFGVMWMVIVPGQM